MKTYEVELYYSTFATVKVRARSELEAIEIAREKAENGEVDLAEGLWLNLEPWEECDQAREIEGGEEACDSKKWCTL